MMRIITGKARGMRLKTLEGYTTRPTAERTKEAIFSMLSSDIEGRRVLDLFAGSGQMGLEAASRGAQSVCLVDKSPQAISIIKENIQKTKLEDICQVINQDFRTFISLNSHRMFDVVFIDPPYASGFYFDAISSLVSNDMLAQGALIVCESADALEIDIANLNVRKRARYGKANVTVFELRGAYE